MRQGGASQACARAPQTSSELPHHGAPLDLGVLTSTSTSSAEASPLDSRSVSPALRAGRMDRPGRPQGDNDIAEQYYNPSKALPRAPGHKQEWVWPSAHGLQS